MVGTAAVDRYQPRRDERLSYILREPEPRHRFGISALAVGQENLFSAGRDGTVRAWNLPAHATANASKSPVTDEAADIDDNPTTSATATAASQKPAPCAVKTFDEHVDWVNDVILVHGYQRLVSCSSDTTVKVWNANDPIRSLRTLSNHTDYVKALAPVPGSVASGGLDARILVWDLVTGRVGTEFTADGDDPTARSASVYSMAGTPDAHVLVSGSTDKTVSVWDVRSGERVVHLRGHADSVRSLALSRDARFMLSGAADTTVKLWDLRHERCVRTFDAYDASVWALAATDTFNAFVCGSRNGAVFYTDIRAGTVTPVVPPDVTGSRETMVLDVALSHDASSVWVSTTGSTIRLWSLPANSENTDNSMHTGTAAAPEKLLSQLPPVCTPNAMGKALAPKPVYEIPGLPGIVAQRIMNDRRHVLTCNTAGEYQIWDITRGILKQALGPMEHYGGDIDEVLKKHDTEVSVPSWFHVDIRLGSLMVRLEKSSVASAEVYAVDAGLEGPTEEVKVNIGEHVLDGLFRKWHERQRAKGIRGVNPSEENMAQSPNGTGAGAGAGGKGVKPAARSAVDLPPYEFPDHIAVVVTEDHSPVPILRCTIGNFKGSEDLHLPSWVMDLVRDGKRLPYEVVKVSFTLEPDETCGLPQLNTTTLTAPRVLRVAKVAAYVAKELKEVPKDGNDVRNELDFEIEANHLEIVCNDQVLPNNMSLATVRQFRWRSPEDLQLQFRLRRVS